MVLPVVAFKKQNEQRFDGVLWETLNFWRTPPVESWDSSVGIALRYGLDGRGSRVRFPMGQEIFLFTSVSRTDLGPSQPPIQWVPGGLFQG
jgi:hypothetical protein